MRVMIKFAFPVEASNEAVRSGKLQKVFQQLTEDLKPEAGYFFPTGGERGGFFVVDMRRCINRLYRCVRKSEKQ